MITRKSKSLTRGASRVRRLGIAAVTACALLVTATGAAEAATSATTFNPRPGIDYGWGGNPKPAAICNPLDHSIEVYYQLERLNRNGWEDIQARMWLWDLDVGGWHSPLAFDSGVMGPMGPADQFIWHPLGSFDYAKNQVPHHYLVSYTFDWLEWSGTQWVKSERTTPTTYSWNATAQTDCNLEGYSTTFSIQL
jgi:hypothetical protein